MIPSMEALNLVITHFGSVRALADALEIKPPTITQWVKHERPIPIERALEMERLTNGLVMAEALCPGKDLSRAAEKTA